MPKKHRKRDVRKERSDAPDRLSELLPKAGLVVKPVESDGNCLFRAFASQLSGDEEIHYDFRQNCCQYMKEEEPEFFAAFLDDLNIDEYISEMREDATWGTQLEVVALCRRYRAHCVIFRPDGLHYRIECENAEGEDLRILMLSHHDEQHFNEVRFKDSERRLSSFGELELLLTELREDIPVLSKKEARQARQSRRRAPEVVEENSHKLIEL